MKNQNETEVEQKIQAGCGAFNECKLYMKSKKINKKRFLKGRNNQQELSGLDTNKKPVYF